MLIEYEKAIEMYPFIEKDFYCYKESTNDVIKMRNKYNKSIFCTLYGSENVDNKVFIDCIVFFQKTLFKTQKINYNGFYEIDFRSNYVIEKSKDEAIYKITVIDNKTKTKTITYTLDRNIFEPKEACCMSYSGLNGEGFKYKNYHNDNGPAIIIKDFNGKILEEHFIINGNEVSEFEFEVLKATNKL